MDEILSKKCSHCSEVKNPWKFYIHKNGGLSGWCKKCTIEVAAASEKKNFEKVSIRKKAWAKQNLLRN